MARQFRRVALALGKVLVVTFVTGNAVASFAGAWPVAYRPLPPSPRQAQVLEGLRAALARSPEDAAVRTQIALAEFLDDDLARARATLQSGAGSRPPAMMALEAALRAKEEKARVDLLFGQRKLAGLRAAMRDLAALARDNADDVTIQTLALSTFAATPDVDDARAQAVALAGPLAQALPKSRAAPELAGAGWLAIARAWDDALTRDGAAARPQAEAARAAALAALDGLSDKPEWVAAQADALRRRRG